MKVEVWKYKLYFDTEYTLFWILLDWIAKNEHSVLKHFEDQEIFNLSMSDNQKDKDKLIDILNSYYIAPF